LKGADRETSDLHVALPGCRACRIGNRAHTAKEVPQPQLPVAFGFSNVNPEP
jgi:hypothetical protein